MPEVQQQHGKNGLEEFFDSILKEPLQFLGLPANNPATPEGDSRTSSSSSAISQIRGSSMWGEDDLLARARSAPADLEKKKSPRSCMKKPTRARKVNRSVNDTLHVHFGGAETLKFRK
mmetsp:Transcript_14693/g.22844  ORF Transcript_14693/g.22844 Transcript_14693/m.22844 type:complete len:118 (+) Transcript_14693:322-675(+)|eukprot:CAMPEP_0184326568 /NCGR_PEP_ID=MMETSP1049-20130417/142633_1 /TAXON_ID=77928 /ORGANISM="Proteomonas sulcata, Strain CCMP704" /LENGTH=117 /DNA_ID=CAMNT_0026648771 /DNA_START=309 /DNA_END=662 /DNA_ORIENTATION=-